MSRITKLARPKQAEKRARERLFELSQDRSLLALVDQSELEKFVIPSRFEPRQMLKKLLATDIDSLRERERELRQLANSDFYHTRRERLFKQIERLHEEILLLDQMYLECDSLLASATTKHALQFSKLESIWKQENEARSPRPAKHETVAPTKAGKNNLQVEAIVAKLATNLGITLAEARKMLGL